MQPLTEEEKLEARRHSALDPIFFCQTFLPHVYKTEIPWFHRGILAILWRQVEFLEGYSELDMIIDHFEIELEPGNADGPKEPVFYRDSAGTLCMRLTPFVQLRVPRGHSKTTLANTKILHAILEGQFRFPVYLSESANHAEKQLDFSKNELTTNAKIQQVWGQMKPVTGTGIWRQDEIELNNGTYCVAQGRGAQIRGKNFRSQRPDMILLDDVEDKESVKTEEQREKARDWLYSDVLPALPTDNPFAPVWMLCTLLHSEALAVTIEKDPAWTVIKFGTTTKRSSLRGSLWPLAKAKVDRDYASRQAVDQLGSYYMEYEGKIRNEQTAIFKSSYFERAGFYKGLPDGEPVATGVAMDPAISAKRTADFAAIVAVSMGLRSGAIYVREAWAKRGATPRELIDKFFELWVKYPDAHMGVESIAYQAALVHLLREEMFRRKKYFEIFEITHSRTDGSKEERIRGILQPRYASGVMHHVERFQQLESQLKDFPNGKKDLPDALSMAVTLLDPYAAAAADPEKDLGDDEYSPLKLTSAI